MILPDVNLLLYAYDTRSRFHLAAKAWWENTLAGEEPIGLCGVVLMAFVRLGTHPRVYENPMSPEEAAGHVQSWLACPPCQFLVFEEMDLVAALGLLEKAGAGANLTTDVQIAALALRLKATIHSVDSDFARFAGVKWVNPLGV